MEGILAILGGLMAGLRGRRRAALEECHGMVRRKALEFQDEIGSLSERLALRYEMAAVAGDELREENRRLRKEAVDDLETIHSLKEENRRLKEETVSPAQFRVVLEALGATHPTWITYAVWLNRRWIADNRDKAIRVVRTVRESMGINEAREWVEYEGNAAVGLPLPFVYLDNANNGQLEELFSILGLPGKDWRLNII